MKLATFSTTGPPGLGAVQGDRIVPLAVGPVDMVGLIAGWERHGPAARAAADAGEGALALSAVRLHAPVLRPSKIMAIGLNYADHVAETGLETPKHQIWFSKQPNTVNGPHDPVEVPLASSQVDYEAEMVAIVGRGGRHISAEEAPARIFGYCVGNDVSVRDWQTATPQWVLGKSFDSHAPFGPWITTADEVGDPHRLDIRALVNGEVRQASNTRHLIFDLWRQVAHLSTAMTLEPGDVIFTGTPGGVGVAMRPPRFLKAGDRVRCEIEGLGAIENLIADEAEPWGTGP